MTCSGAKSQALLDITVILMMLPESPDLDQGPAAATSRGQNKHFQSQERAEYNMRSDIHGPQITQRTSSMTCQ